MNSYLEKTYITLLKLKDGWYNGEGVAYDRSELSWLMHEFDMHFDVDLPKPVFYPTPDNNVVLQWLWRGWDITCDINLKHQTAIYHAWNQQTEEEHQGELDFQDVGWNNLNMLLSIIFQ